MKGLATNQETNQTYEVNLPLIVVSFVGQIIAGKIPPPNGSLTLMNRYGYK